MPELPEVERAAARLRAWAVGRRIARLALLHPALRRKAGDLERTVRGYRIEAVHRRGKQQLLRLAMPDAGPADDGLLTLHVHFRMAGDWVLDATDRPLPPHARATLDLDDGTRVVLVDPRALSTIHLVAGHGDPAGLGPEASDPNVTPADLRQRMHRHRGPIKPALLDQRVLAGIGNIYASEALWHAGIHPAVPAARIGAVRMTRLLAGIRTALEAGATGATRYTDAAVESLEVYGREGKPCRRCGGVVRRVTQAGRSSFFCGGCQRR